MFLLSKAMAQKPVALSWKLEGNLLSEDNRHLGLGVAGPVTGYTNTMLVIAGGANFPDSLPWKGGKKKYHNKVSLFACDTKQFRPIHTSFQLPFSIAYTANCSTNKGIVYAGGENESGLSNKVFLLNWDGAAATLQLSMLPDLPVAITNASADCTGTIVYVAGGETAQGVSNKLYALDLNNTGKGWEQLADLPLPVSHAVVLAVKRNGKDFLYIAGGRCKQANGVSDLYNHLFIYDIANNSWKEGRPLPYAVSAGTGAVVPERGILVFGGDTGEVFHKVEVLNAAIQQANSEENRKRFIDEKNQLLAGHPGFSKEILFFDFAKEAWVRSGTIPFKTPVTTTAVKIKETIFIPSGEIRAGVRSPAILSVKLTPKRK